MSFTDELEDAARTRAALGVLSEHTRVLDAAGSDEHVQKLRRRGPQHLLEELQSCRDNIVVPVLRIVEGQLIHLQKQESKVSSECGVNAVSSVSLDHS